MIRLRSIRDDGSNGFELDPSAGLYRRVDLPPDARSAAVRGFADIREIGLRVKQEIFAAIYSFEGELHVAIPPQHFRWPGPYIVRRRSVFSQIKSLVIKSGARTYLRFFYFFIDSQHEFPGPEAMDIFKMIAWKTSTPQEICGAIYLWEGLSRGEDLTDPDFRQHLKSAQMKTEGSTP